MPEIFDVIQTDSIELINNVRANLGATGTNATMSTSQSLRIEVKQEGLKYKMQLFGRSFFMTVQTGRKPTPDKKPSRAMVDNIKKWIAARGMNESAAWAIATNINKKGTKLWQSGGREDILDPAADVFVNDVSMNILETAADDFLSKIRVMSWR